eukprot:1185834-Prorocentrum_minimum.AAC.2
MTLVVWLDRNTPPLPMFSSRRSGLLASRTQNTEAAQVSSPSFVTVWCHLTTLSGSRDWGLMRCSNSRSSNILACSAMGEDWSWTGCKFKAGAERAWAGCTCRAGEGSSRAGMAAGTTTAHTARSVGAGGSAGGGGRTMAGALDFGSVSCVYT